MTYHMKVQNYKRLKIKVLMSQKQKGWDIWLYGYGLIKADLVLGEYIFILPGTFRYLNAHIAYKEVLGAMRANHYQLVSGF